MCRYPCHNLVNDAWSMQTPRGYGAGARRAVVVIRSCSYRCLDGTMFASPQLTLVPEHVG